MSERKSGKVHNPEFKAKVGLEPRKRQDHQRDSAGIWGPILLWSGSGKEILESASTLF